MYCLCVNVYCTTATGCQHNCSYQIYKLLCQIYYISIAWNLGLGLMLVHTQNLYLVHDLPQDTHTSERYLFTLQRNAQGAVNP